MRSNKIHVLCVRGVGAGETRGENESGEWFCIGSHFIWAVNIDSSELCWAGPGPGLIASPQHFPRVGDLTQIEMATRYRESFRTIRSSHKST